MEYTSMIILSILFTLMIIVIYKIVIGDQIIISELFKISSGPKYKLGIISIFKNEQDYMEEWLDFHIAQGFDQIYLYSNDSNLEKYSFLTNPKYRCFIKLINWVNKQNDGANTIQRQAYWDCVKKYGSECQFLLLLDLDEFVHPYKQFKSVGEYIDSLKNEWKNIKCFKIQRYNFGSDGHITKPNISVTTAYTKHEKKCSTYKAMANTDYIDTHKQFYGVHDFPYINVETKAKVFNEYLNYDKTGFPCGCDEQDINEIPLVINHYYTKSYEEYMKRCELWKDGGINPIGYRKNCNLEFALKDMNVSNEFKI